MEDMPGVETQKLFQGPSTMPALRGDAVSSLKLSNLGKEVLDESYGAQEAKWLESSESGMVLRILWQGVQLPVSDLRCRRHAVTTYALPISNN